MVDRIVTGANYGLRDWIMQRATAVVMLAYTVIVILMLLSHQPLNHDAWRGIFSHTWMKLASVLFFASLYLHAWVGVRDIFMDYIKPTGLRLVLQAGLIIALFVYMAWTVQILWSV